MLDIKRIREDPVGTLTALNRRGNRDHTQEIIDMLVLDEHIRWHKQWSERLREYEKKSQPKERLIHMFYAKLEKEGLGAAQALYDKMNGDKILAEAPEYPEMPPEPTHESVMKILNHLLPDFQPGVEPSEETKP